MPRGVYKRKSAKKLVKKTTRRRRSNQGVVDIPTIGRSQLIKSSIHPRSSSSFSERTVEVERGTTLIIKII